MVKLNPDERLLVEEVKKFEKQGGRPTQDNVIFACDLRQQIMEHEALLHLVYTGQVDIELKDPIEDSVIALQKK